MGRRTGKPAGRPRKKSAETAAAAVEAGRTTQGDAARIAGVSDRTVRRRQGEIRKKTTKPLAAAAPPSAAAEQERRATLLALLAQALAADPALEAALPLDVGELGRRLGDPGLVVEGDLDELAILGRVQGRLEAAMAKLDSKAATTAKALATALTQIAGTAARIRAGRPSETESPEVLAARRLVEVRDRAIARIGVLMREAVTDGSPV